MSMDYLQMEKAAVYAGLTPGQANHLKYLAIWAWPEGLQQQDAKALHLAYTWINQVTAPPAPAACDDPSTVGLAQLRFQFMGDTESTVDECFDLDEYLDGQGYELVEWL